MGTEHSRLGWQRRKPLERRPRLRWRPFKESTTAQSEERVTDEGSVGVRQVVSDLSECVPPHVDHPHFVTAERERVAAADRLVD
eukprot:CAMPEP_0181171386 /NCGR_PEP_ID=MMETSP1096-20121128/1880_1 /TAXON_ID=156174 ORGANISM="Chrysochromulina ericina, Strain CCMP281" /NCGR_SAMPLE_ID=MMETSP1096 /ASSEMBLY_ACC=CAM_ASM_000453 /LENGTH=83 /DNA_ID=CAMNT_0023259027 /DNA_START=738 /DNA_END=989 /DNA_ORIENTATION=-